MDRNCILCGTKFRTFPSKVLLGRGKYCSRACSDSVTLIKRGERRSKGTEIKKGNKLALGVKKDTVWNKGVKGVCKANSGSFKKGEHKSIGTEFRIGTPIYLHPRWQGGKSFEPYPLGWTKTHREQIRYRDGYTCQACGKPEVEESRRLSVHHINYNKEDIREDNLISLCLSCHCKTNSNREYWKGYFGEVMVKSHGNTVQS